MTVFVPRSFVTPFQNALLNLTSRSVMNSRLLKAMKMENELSEFFRKHFFSTNHKAHHLSELIDEDTSTIVALDRFRKLDNIIEGH
jgi:hypothetical protein